MSLTLWDWRRRVFDLYAAVRAAGDGPEGWASWREGRDALFRDHPQTPLPAGARAGFTGLPFYRYDPALRFVVGAEPVAGEPLQVEVGRDGALVMTAFARTTGLAERLGGELTLYWIGGYGGGAFLPFRDATAGTDTYGGGRYLLDTIKGADLGRAPDGGLILDFNFAYNPSCSYSDLWVCPLSPPENTLRSAVRAGEKSGAG